MASVFVPPLVFTPFTISGSRNDSIPIGLAPTLTFQSRRRFPAVRGVIFDSPRCQASRAASPLLVSHSESDWPPARFGHNSVPPRMQSEGKAISLRNLLEQPFKDIKLAPSWQSSRSIS